MLGPSVLLLASLWVALAGSPAPSASDGLEHAQCTYSGDAGRHFLGAGLGPLLQDARRQAELNATVSSRLPSPRHSPAPARAASARASASSGGPAQVNSIDDLVFAELERKGIPPAAACNDARFLRRVSLDLTGRIPTVAEVTSFLQDASSDKRERVVERLLASPQWADRWTLFVGDLLANTERTTLINRFAGRDSLHLYIRAAIRRNTAFDRLVRNLLTASGTNDGRNWPTPTSRASPFRDFATYQVFLADERVRPRAANYLVGGYHPGGPVQDTFDRLASLVARRAGPTRPRGRGLHPVP